MKRILILSLCMMSFFMADAQTTIWYWKNNTPTKVENIDSITFVEPTNSGWYDQEKKDRLDYGTSVYSELPVLMYAGAIYSNENIKPFTIQDQKLGIFMLAKGIIPDNNYTDLIWDNVNWANRNKTVSIDNIGSFVDTWSAPIWNQSANVIMYDSNGYMTTDITKGTNSSVIFNGLQPYYPVGNYCSYNLYGYYPLQSLSDQNVKVEKSKLTVTIPVSGKDDVLWGRASYSQNDVAGTNIKWFTPGELTGIYFDGKEITDFTKYGYSAKFFRCSPFRTTDGTDVALNPTMKFKHKMIMLKFDVVAGGTAIDYAVGNQNYDRAYKTTVSGLTIDNAPESIDLVIADLSGAANEGKVTASTTTKAIAIDGSATPEKGADGKPQRVSVKDADGNEAYVILPAITASTYNLSVTLTDNNVTPATTKTIPVPLSLKTKNNFEEGKIYRLILKIWNLETLKLEATLDNLEEIDATEENWSNYPLISEGDHTIPVH